jgi:hypothetical protein
MSQDAFVPYGSSGTVNLTPSATSQSVQIPIPSPPLTYRVSVRVRNTSTEEVFIRFDTAAPTANSATDIPIAPNSVEVIGVPDMPSHLQGTPVAAIFVAVIAAGVGSGPIYFTAGFGE